MASFEQLRNSKRVKPKKSYSSLARKAIKEGRIKGKPSYHSNDAPGSDVWRSKRWQETRAVAFNHMPVCLDPFGVHGSRVVATEEIHHIVPLHKDPDRVLAFKLENLAGLCKSCHKRADILDLTDHGAQVKLMNDTKLKHGLQVVELQ